jgi:hypothetical protein
MNGSFLFPLASFLDETLLLNTYKINRELVYLSLRKFPYSYALKRGILQKKQTAIFGL